MRQLINPLMVISIIISLCGLATAQSDQVYPGAYAEPFSPRLSTPVAQPDAVPPPTLTLNSPPLTVGASNATLNIWTGTSVVFSQPLWYEPGTQASLPLDVSSAELTQSEEASAATSGAERPFELGAATFQSSYGVRTAHGHGSAAKSSSHVHQPGCRTTERR
jgi:hypothetical protein